MGGAKTSNGEGGVGGAKTSNGEGGWVEPRLAMERVGGWSP